MTPYILTDATVEILRNFANINDEATFTAGHAQRACNPSRNFIADVELADALPVDCSIYELNRLLGIIDTCKGDALPTLTFGETSLVVNHEHGEVTLPYAHADIMAKPPAKSFFMADQIASFDLPLTLWNKIKKTAAVLHTSALHIIVTKSGDLKLRLVNEKDKGGDSSGSAEFNMPNTLIDKKGANTWMVKFDVLQLLPGDYTVTIGDVGGSTSSEKIFGMFFTLNSPTKKVTYLTSGHLVKGR